MKLRMNICVLSIIFIVFIGAIFQNFNYLVNRIDVNDIKINVTKNLSVKGYIIGDGEFEFLNIEDCFTKENSSCFGNNPTTPYGIVRAPIELNEAEGIGESDIFLREDEAIVIMGYTPPKAKYYGFTPYLFTQEIDKPQRKYSFGSLTDTINLLNIKTMGNVFRGENVFNQFTVLIMTADYNVYDIIVQQFQTLGIPSYAINHLEVPVTFPLNMGHNLDSDGFTALLRIALPENPLELEAYKNSTPFQVFRVTPETPQKIQSVNVREYTNEVTGVSEEDIVPGVSTALHQLQRAIRIKYSTKSNKSVVTETQYTQVLGHECISGDRICNGDNHDALYGKQTNLPFKLSDDPNDFIIVTGVDHKKLGKAIYTNHSVYRIKNMGGIVSVTDSQFQGSAQYHSGKNRDIYKYLYAYKIARKCSSTEKYCLEVPYRSDKNAVGADPDDYLYLVSRIYVDPTTGVRPSIKEIIPSKSIIFKQR